MDYHDRRADFVKAFFDHLINWDFANANMSIAASETNEGAPTTMEPNQEPMVFPLS